jgi:hypothetical protein
MNILQRLQRSTIIALILSPTGLLLIAVVRLLVISNYNQATASTIVSSGGYVNTLLGTVIPLVPIFLPCIALILLFFKRTVAGVLTLATSVLISPTAINRETALKLGQEEKRLVFNWAITHPLPIPLAVVAAFLLAFTLGSGLDAFARTVGTIASLALIPYMVQLYTPPHTNNFYAKQLRQPWLPPEMITLTSGQVYVGYVLPSDNDWLVVLRDDTRRVIYYPSKEVTQRQVCQIGTSTPMAPLAALTSPPTAVPPCVQFP